MYHPAPPPDHNLLVLAVVLERPRGQLRSAFWALHPLSQALPICGPFPCHPAGVGVYLHFPQIMAGLKHHVYCLADVCMQADMVKEVHKDSKIILDTACSRPCDQAVASIEVQHQALYRPPESLWACLLCCYNGHPVAHDRIHDNIEERGKEGVALHPPI